MMANFTNASRMAPQTVPLDRDADDLAGGSSRLTPTIFVRDDAGHHHQDGACDSRSHHELAYPLENVCMGQRIKLQ